MTETVDYLVLDATFVTKLPVYLFDACFEFERFTLDREKLNIENLLNTHIYLIKNEKNVNNILIEGMFKYNIRKDDNDYLMWLKNIPEDDSLYDYEFMNIMIRHRGLIFQKLVSDIVGYMKWKKKLNYSSGVFDYITVDCVWNLDGRNGYFNNVIDSRKTRLIGYFTVDCVSIDADDFDKFYELRIVEKHIPLHHELLSEVERLIRIKSYRSAFLMLYSSIEVATRTLVSERKEQTEYLINNMPSPPLTTLYVNYINKEIAEILMPNEKKILNEMTELRNKIAHRGLNVPEHVMYIYLQLVKDLTARIDIQLGY